MEESWLSSALASEDRKMKKSLQSRWMERWMRPHRSIRTPRAAVA
jgi:hypothetical protein